MLNDYQGAKEDFSKAIEIDPQNSIVFNARGKLKVKQGKYDEGILGLINNEWYFVKDIVSPKKSNKFEIVSSISRMIYFENRLIKKNNDEVNLQTRVTLKKK